MRIIFQIAKNELRNLFYSPIAWFLTFIMMLMCAFYYIGVISFIAKYSHMMHNNTPNIALWSFESLTKGLYINPFGGFLVTILPHLYLFVPLLTMGIISREFNSGTIRLLYSSPLKLRTIVLGKFMGVAILNLLLVTVVGTFLVAGFFNIKSLDYLPLLCASLGIYLFLCALSAIGFFMSSLSTYHIVSAIASFTVLFILGSIGTMWQEYDFIRDITFFLSLPARMEKIMLGLLVTKDVLYYFIIIAMFIAFTWLKLKAGQETSPWYLKTVRYLTVLIVGLTIGYIGSRPQFTLYFDTTQTKFNTVHPRTQQLIKRMNDGPLEVTLFTNLFASSARAIGFPQSRNVYLSQTWEGYQRFKTDINYKYEYYYALPKNEFFSLNNYPGKTLQQVAELTARTQHVDPELFKSPEEISKMIDLGPEGYAVIMQLKYKGRTALLRFYNDGSLWPNQQNVNAALSRLLQDSIPSVYFITGELERDIYKEGEREYFNQAISKRNRESLINTGFDVDSINLSIQDIPDSTSILVMADPKMALSSTVLKKLKTYINKGGNMLVLGEPGKQSVLNPLLSHIGIQFSNGQLIEPKVNETPEKITNYYTLDGFNLAEQTTLLQYKYVWENGSTSDSLKVGLAGATAITFSTDNSFSINALYLTSPGKAWLKAGKLVADSAMPVFSALEGDIQDNSFATAIELSRQINNKEQRIIIAGDADFLSNLRANYSAVLPLYSWLSHNKSPVYTPYPRAKDNVFILSPTGATLQKILFLWVLPAFVLVISSVILIRRKRK